MLPFLALSVVANTTTIELVSDRATVTSSRTDPVTITGHGRLVGTLSAPFNLTDVTIASGAEVAADGLTVLRRLHLEGSSLLMGVSGDWVSIATGADIIFTAHGSAVPRVNLGGVGRAYATNPGSISVNIKVEDFTDADLLALHTPIVSGRTLSNCENWKKVSRLIPVSGRFKFECDPPTNATVDESGIRGLYLMAVPDWADPPSKNWVMIVVVVCSVVAVAGVVITVCMCRRTSQKDGIVVSTLDTKGYVDSPSPFIG